MKKVGIIAAMEEEMQAIKVIMDNANENKIYDLIFYEGKIADNECVLLKCGVGKVNAARATQVLIDNYDLEYVINIGSAGSINNSIDYGDIVIGKELVQHDFDITAFGHPKGYITDIGVVLKSNQELIKKCECAIKKIVNNEYNIIIGTIATGDIFCTSIKMKNKIREKLKADCVEMEGASIAQVCSLCNIPFVVIRSISDSPNENNHIEFNEYLNMASKRCSAFIKLLLE